METPQLANMVMITCSLMLNGPGFRLKLQPLKSLTSFLGSTPAMNRPRGSAAICIKIAEIVSGCVRKVKKVLRKIRRTQQVKPRNHARNVITGIDGSSVSGTTRATSSTGHRSAANSSEASGGVSCSFRTLGSPFEAICESE
ncbi:uncharacterized protein LOC110109836 [Dendrobium catenatum]|uniref:uncharacterized protein LOC110109836 n=1 Tax=Dendrobium catenatum TaxID=906689 RepID=UPI0009F1A848|nr:uncharacterized protein LOC110109836 [Dendrobium catenatum]